MFKWLILNYHYVHDKSGYPFKNLKGNTVDQFRKQVRALKNNFQIVPAGIVIKEALSGQATGNFCSITFDDGIIDIYDNALPVLLDEGAKATFFVSSSTVMDRSVLSVQKIHLLLGEMGMESFRIKFLALLEKYAGKYELNDLKKYGISHNYKYDIPDVADFKMKLNFLLPYSVRDAVLDEIFVSVFGNEVEVFSKLYVQLEQIKEMKSLGMEIGSHFHTHSVMAFLSDAQQRYEVERGIDLLKECKNETLLFSFPFGGQGVCGKATLQALSDYSVDASFTMGRECADLEDIKRRQYFIPRYSTDDVFVNKGEEFALPEFFNAGNLRV